ncbi:DUF3349 domain-containing protein [Mycolicibacterium brumae]|uniref:DUF3349 domain-containing protein n=1 Tax=Mycolicibacterium brumae TaxID=85968 RepID=A0A2G5PGV5_9MYCO|nr:DUF3349 domain-containing protein [Mycolicibacterium brumae]MCV7192448.1 DUF3349 domain-containing protein [Mycolicibacterium brumae]PIB77542.1 DUF3349 domain-containing protein [Mycolicibacterium brumae]RWA18559.1 hypothetical protein MBRU_04890 [Mycolicibacterium brumae DSM 44177]UWW10216.1 DUF3349 domain-containing protein [Mycolicibacterium brumae]
MSDFLNRIVTWLRAGYPNGVPQNDYLPLFALLRRQLTVEEIKFIAEELAASADPPIDNVDIGVEVMSVIDDLPAPVDVERVRERLIAKGWPLDDLRDDSPVDTGRAEDGPESAS